MYQTRTRASPSKLHAKPNAPHLIGNVSWDAWSQAIKKCLNDENVYFALHEETPYKSEEDLPTARDLRKNPLVNTWVAQTQDEEANSTSSKVQRRKYAEEVKNDFNELGRADARAKAIILGNIHDNVANEILSGGDQFEGSAKQLWAKLERIHQGATLDNVGTAIAHLEHLGEN
jgi:hypothetical protein